MVLGLSNNYIAKLGNNLSNGSFLGVFPIDLRPDLFSTKQSQISMIINLDPHFKKGSHFVAIFKNKDLITYFDSFGEGPNKTITDYLQKFKLPVKINRKKIQSDFSDYCGYYCLGFIITQEIGIHIEKFIKFFFTVENHNCENNGILLLNDSLITHLIKTFIRRR